MRYAKPTLRDSFFGWLGVSAPAPEPDPGEQLQCIRERMLDELCDCYPAGGVELSRRIRLTRDVAGLWYHRVSLMQVLSPIRGEAHSGAVLAEITQLFEGLLPAGMVCPGPVARRH